MSLTTNFSGMTGCDVGSAPRMTTAPSINATEARRIDFMIEYYAVGDPARPCDNKIFMLVETLEGRMLFSAAPEVLFIRGAVRSGGFLEGTDAATRTAQLADINDTSTAADNSGWGTFAQTLRDDGYEVSEMVEAKGAGGTQTFVNGKPVPFAQLDLSQYAAIVFGSNNARYDVPDRKAVQQYINAGGGALFITDANFGSNWRDADDSDQMFLASYGVIVNQDNAAAVATQTRSSGAFVDPTHPLLNGVNSFTAEGVSSFTIPDAPPAGVTVERVVAASGKVRNNDSLDAGTDYEGSLRAATDRDADLVAITSGYGRVVAFGDRNSFFNANGLGTDITQADNQRLAGNILNWLTDH